MAEGSKEERSKETGSPGDDPFAGLVLDDEFIAGAKTYEAPARTRAAVARFGGTTDLGRSWSSHEPSRFRHKGSSRRRWLIVAGMGVALILAAGYAVIRADGTGQAPTASPVASPSPDWVELNRWSYDRGRCYIWNQDAEHTTADEVPCSSPHLFEAIEKTNIASDYPTGSAYPTDAQWREIASRYCDPISRKFLGYTLDPHGRFKSGPIRPSRLGWESGDRDLVCGLIVAPMEVGEPNRLALFAGLVEGADQAFVYPPGTCLEFGEKENKGPVPCGAPHQAEVTGAATLPDTADGEPPSAAALKEFANSRCQGVATRFLERPFEETSNMRVSWLHLAAESWRAGTRTFNCLIIFVDAQGNYRAVTGALSRGSGAATA